MTATSDDVPYLDEEMQERIISAAANLVPDYEQASSELTLVTIALHGAMEQITKLGPTIPEDVAFDYEVQMLHWYIAAMILALVQERQEHANTIARLNERTINA